MKQSEQAIAAAVVAYLEGCGHDVYQEVAVRRATGGGVADIVALVGQGREVWIVEVKTGWCLDLLRQCVDRRRFAHRVFAACPASRNQHDTQEICRDLGIGVLMVHIEADEDQSRKVIPAVMARRQSSDPRFAAALRARCSEGHKTHAKAGAPSAGGRYTPFRDTCAQLERVVRGAPGISLRDAIDQIRHHYGSVAVARSTLPKWIEEGKVPGVQIVREGRRVHLHPTREDPSAKFFP